MFKKRSSSFTQPLAPIPSPLLFLLLAAAIVPAVRADWFTGGSDAQRDRWVRTDPKISPQSIPNPDFHFLWKIKLPASVSPALLLNRYIGYRGFRALAFVSSGNTIAAIETDLGYVEWRKTFPGSSGCGIALTRAASPTIVPAPEAGLGALRHRYTPAVSSAGLPDQGAVTIAQAEARAKLLAGPAGRGSYGRFRGERIPDYIYAITADGRFHALYLSNGEEPKPAVPFLPANSAAHGFIVVNNVAYAASAPNCTAAPDTLWALDLATKEVSKFPGAASAPSIGPDGTVYTAARGKLVALDPKTLAVKSSYSAGQDFATAPVIFRDAGKTLIAAATKDGRLHILGAATLDKPYLVASLGAAPTALATWQDSAGARWLLVSLPDSITAWRLTGQQLQRAWAHDLPKPLAPMIVNGVVFAASTGTSASPAVVYALDGDTGKVLWSSGRAIAASARRGGLSASDSQLYLGANDGMFYAFGFWIERE